MLRYRADIDGLRAIAVLPVILFHAGVAGFSGGFVGVDVFFVVSGYLITSIIVAELDAGTFTLAGFYERRVRRILPALFLVMAVSIPPALIVLVPAHLEDFGQSVIAAALFVSNFFFYLEEGYFEGPAELHPLLHTWSLAVEEQFYLLFPPLMLLLTRFGRRYLPGLVILALASFGFGLWQLEVNPSAAFYLLPARFWELMLGAVLAVVMAERGGLPGRFGGVLVALGLGLIAAAVFGFDERTPFPGVAALLPCVGALLVILGGHTDNTLTRLLGAAPLKAVGLISYSLYLWHFPLIVFSRHVIVRPFEAVEVMVLVIATFLLATLSWRYVEQPFRIRPRRIEQPALWRWAGGALAVSVGFGLFTDLSDGAPNRLAPEARAYLAAREDRDTACLRKGINCEIGDPDQEPRFLVWGDSHAGALLAAFHTLSAETGVPGRAALRGGCLPLLGYRLVHLIAESCAAHVQATFEEVVSSDIETVFLAARWTMVAEESMYGFESGTALVARDAAAPDPDEPNWSVVSRAFVKTLAALEAADKRVVVIGPVPEIGWHVPHVLAQRERFGALLDDITINPSLHTFLERNGRTVALIESAAAAHGAAVIWPHEVLCPAASGCAVLDGDRPLYFDTDHLTLTGARRLVDALRPEIAALQ